MRRDAAGALVATNAGPRHRKQQDFMMVVRKNWTPIVRAAVDGIHPSFTTATRRDPYQQRICWMFGALLAEDRVWDALPGGSW